LTFKRYFSKEKYSNLLERVPYAFLIISGVLLVLDVIGILLMFERKDDDQSLSDNQSEYIIQNADGLDLSPDTSTERFILGK